jgi:hypothetical protein
MNGPFVSIWPMCERNGGKKEREKERERKRKRERKKEKNVP